MNFISVMAVTEHVARQLGASKTGYRPETVGRLVLIAEPTDNSRQKNFIFETSNDVTRHPDYLGGKLSDIDRPGQMADKAEDGPMLTYGPEVTVGG